MAKTDEGLIPNPKIRYSLLFFILSSLLYSLMTYGGIRSPDSELVFRTGFSLVTEGTFAISEELVWKGFGVSPGKDGRQYAFFGPGEALASVPLIYIAQTINKTSWYEGLSTPISHYVGSGLLTYVTGGKLDDPEAHALRFIVSLLNVLVCAMAVVVFFLLIDKLTQSIISAVLVTIIFAFGTMIFPYSGTFFSEPLAILFVLISLYTLVLIDMNGSANGSRPWSYRLVLSGISLGMAITTHVTAGLFAPFFLAYAAYLQYKKGALLKEAVHSGALFMLGLGVILVLLGCYNYARFGSFMETGRTIGQSGYMAFLSPWEGLKGLLWSSGKGLLWYCPAIIPALIFWRYLHKERAFLSVMIITAVAVRLLFFASRHYWHGGFCLGPRYMIMIIPLMLIPLGFLVKDLISKNKKTALWLFGGFSFICISQQIYFCLGEIFSYLHIVKWNAANQGIDAFKNHLIYLDWNVSPLLYLLNGKRSPFLLQGISLGNYTLWYIGISITACAVALIYYRYTKELRQL